MVRIHPGVPTTFSDSTSLTHRGGFSHRAGSSSTGDMRSISAMPVAKTVDRGVPCLSVARPLPIAAARLHVSQRGARAAGRSAATLRPAACEPGARGVYPPRPPGARQEKTRHAAGSSRLRCYRTQPPRTTDGARGLGAGPLRGGAAIRPSRMAFFRAALRARRTASPASRTRFSDGFS